MAASRQARRNSSPEAKNQIPTRASSPSGSEKGGSRDSVQLSGFSCHLLARRLSAGTHSLVQPSPSSAPENSLPGAWWHDEP